MDSEPLSSDEDDASVPNDDNKEEISDLNKSENCQDLESNPNKSLINIGEAITDILDEHKIEVPESARVEIRSVVKRMMVSAWSGPLPNPKAFGEYGIYVPDAPERILSMAEKEQYARLDIDRKKTDTEIEMAKRDMSITEKDSAQERSLQFVGLFMAFALALLFVLSAVYLLANDKQLGGFVSLGTGLALIIGPFIYWRTRNEPK